MEDDEWARRQREWDAWRAEEEAERTRRKRKEAYRRERGDIKRGHWTMTEPSTTDK